MLLFIVRSGYYAAGRLEKTTVTDEDGLVTESFTDNGGENRPEPLCLPLRLRPPRPSDRKTVAGRGSRILRLRRERPCGA